MRLFASIAFHVCAGSVGGLSPWSTSFFVKLTGDLSEDAFRLQRNAYTELRPGGPEARYHLDGESGQSADEGSRPFSSTPRRSETVTCNRLLRRASCSSTASGRVALVGQLLLWLPRCFEVDGTEGIPILVVDVWEHAYYLKHRPQPLQALCKQPSLEALGPSRRVVLVRYQQKRIDFLKEGPYGTTVSFSSEDSVFWCSVNFVQHLVPLPVMSGLCQFVATKLVCGRRGGTWLTGPRPLSGVP